MQLEAKPKAAMIKTTETTEQPPKRFSHFLPRFDLFNPSLLGSLMGITLPATQVFVDDRSPVSPLAHGMLAGDLGTHGDRTQRIRIGGAVAS